MLAWLETVPSVLGTCGYWESQPSLQKCDLGASILRNKACGLIAGLALILPACCSVRVPMLICAASALTPRAAMADLVLSFLFEHQYRHTRMDGAHDGSQNMRKTDPQSHLVSWFRPLRGSVYRARMPMRIRLVLVFGCSRSRRSHGCVPAPRALYNVKKQRWFSKSSDP